MHARDAPSPALAEGRHWNMVAHNRIAPRLPADIDELPLIPPINVQRLSLHQNGREDGQLASELGGVVFSLRLKTSFGVMSFISITRIFGTAADVTLQELAIETLFAADEATTMLLRGLAWPGLAWGTTGQNSTVPCTPEVMLPASPLRSQLHREP
jgi:hypothetical protein